ncbi:MAG: diguanylate phosphodiesterase [Proteobacteria bacterium ST_bin12]|nr:MAG: diguanylate phosphodiesterase [Proteobacteria bacterium ST_bin12]
MADIENKNQKNKELRIAHTHIEQLRLQLKESLFLELDEYGLAEQSTGEFNSTFLGVQLNSAFQPIYDSLAGDLFGHEALLRPSLGGELPSTSDFAYSYAAQSGKLVPFDRVSRALHVLNFRQIFAENGLLFLTVHPNLLISVNAHGKVFERILHANSVPTDRVVIQIDEGLVAQDKPLIEAIQNYRDRGYRIALEHFGNTHSHIDRLWKLAPDFVKLDSSLIQQAQTNDHLYKILPSLISGVKELDARAVITGVETQTQLNIAIESGATLLQGDFLGKAVAAKELQKVHVSNALSNKLHAA